MTIWTVEEHYQKHHHHRHHKHDDDYDDTHHSSDESSASLDLGNLTEHDLTENLQQDLSKHPMEAVESWLAFTARNNLPGGRQHLADEQEPRTRQRQQQHQHQRQLKHHHNHKHAKQLEAEMEDQFWKDHRAEQASAAAELREERLRHRVRVQELSAHPGIAASTRHGIMVDAGSTGSRLHVYEWEPRVLRGAGDVRRAAAGDQLSFPGTESRWTDRLQPGLGSFASSVEGDAELLRAVADYLQPLLDFAKSVLHSKADRFGEFPIFLRATAGMRVLGAADRARVVGAVRALFRNETYCPFAFADEQARVISGEEEAVYDWAGVNFLLGDLLSQSHGSGTVINPQLTHGALDMGGGSTQISFYENSEDIMSNLFKLQVGQAKHWNIYAHSFLFYGMNEAAHRFHAKLAANRTREERLIAGVHNPCLPHGGTARQEIRTNIHYNGNGVETWDYFGEHYPSGNGFFQATLVNDESANDVDLCMDSVKSLLHLEKNDWCDFAHGDCSLAGIYQPKLPSDVEFVAFSNYYHVWKFLHLPERATIAQLEEATRRVCAMSHAELAEFNTHHSFEDDLDSYCFRSAYTFQLLHNGYGFSMTDTLRATNVIEGHKVGWALGAMLYEINTMPWQYESEEMNFGVLEINTETGEVHIASDLVLLVIITFGTIFSLLVLFVRRERNLRNMYEPVKDVSISV